MSSRDKVPGPIRLEDPVESYCGSKSVRDCHTVSHVNLPKEKFRGFATDGLKGPHLVCLHGVGHGAIAGVGCDLEGLELIKSVLVASCFGDKAEAPCDE